MADLNYSFDGSNGVGAVYATLDQTEDNISLTFGSDLPDNAAGVYTVNFTSDTELLGGANDIFTFDIPEGWTADVTSFNFRGFNTYTVRLSDETEEEVALVTFNGLLNPIPCFASGTQIETQTGLCTVEDLREGDMVLTRDHGYQPLRWSGHSRITPEAMVQAPELRPVRIGAGAMDNTEDLIVSPRHRMLVEDWRLEALFGQPTAEGLATAESLINERTITRAHDLEEVVYVHLLFDTHQLVKANGAWSESFHPAQISEGHFSAQTAEEVLALFPELEADRTAYSPLVRRPLGPGDVLILD